VLALVAGFAAVQTADRARRDRNRAEQAASIADARRVGAQALNHELAAASLLLGVEATRVDDSPQAWENLAATLTRLGSLTRIQDTGDYIVSLAASGDGVLVAASQPVGGVQLFDARSMNPIPFDDATASSAVTFAPGGRLMAAAVNQWTPQGPPTIDSQPVRLYEMPAGELADRQLGGWPEGASVEYSLAFSRDGRRIVAGVQRLIRGEWTKTGAVMVWDLANPEKPVFTVALPELAQAALSPDGRRVYTATTDERSVRAYDVDSGRLLRWTGPGRGTQAGMKGASDVSPDGSTFAIAAGAGILRFDTATLKARGPVLQGHTGEVTDIEYSHDGSMLLSASDDRSAIVWDADSGARLRQFTAQSDQSWGATFSPDDRAVYTASGDGTLMTWDLTGRSDLLSVGGKAIDETNGTSLAGPDGRTIARVAAGRLWFADHLTGRTVRSARQPELDNYAWSPDGRRFVSALRGELSLWDTATGALLAGHAYPPYSSAAFAFSPAGDKLFVDDGHGAVEILDSSSMQPAGGAATLAGDIMLLVAHPRDGTVLALKSDGSVRRVDPDTGRIVDASPPFLLSIETFVAAFSPDGSRMAVANPDGQLQLLDVDTFRWVGEPSRTAWGQNVVYAPDGSQFASVQPDRIRLWDGRTGAYQASVPLTDLPSTGLVGTATLGPGISISYVPDSSGLLVASADGRSWTVDTRRSAWVQRACRIAGRNLKRAEWRQSFPDRPYQTTCKQWPAGG
jgi:WD40 repeat protein